MTITIIAILLLVLANLSFACFGRINSEGCHNNRKTGDYHCHRSKAPKPSSYSVPKADPPGDFSCSGKRYCGEMSNCAEARFYMTKCGLVRLDGDKDGIPCEKLCN